MLKDSVTTIDNRVWFFAAIRVSDLATLCTSCSCGVTIPYTPLFLRVNKIINNILYTHTCYFYLLCAYSCLFFLAEPDFPYLDALAPFQPLAMKAVHCPIDTSLNFTQANKLIRDLKPEHLVIPDSYTQPPLTAQHRTDLVIETIEVGIIYIFIQLNKYYNQVLCYN